MSHVDKGALHAYLDGALDEYPAAEAERIRAHLDACAECAARLEVERRTRSDAHAMLALASPVVEVPSLEELRAYVQRTAQQRRGISRFQRMGWAASVVLALGAGWMLRDGQLQSRALDIGADLAPRSGVSSAVEAPAESDAVSSEAGRAASQDFLDGAAAGAAATLQRSDRGAIGNESVVETEVLGGRARPSSPAEEATVDTDVGRVGATMADASAEEREAEPLPKALDRLEQVAESPVVSADGAVAAPADVVATTPEASAAVAGEASGAGAGEAVALTGRVDDQRASAAGDSSQPAGPEARRRQVREATNAPPAVVANAALVEPAPARGNAEADASRSLVLEVEATDDEDVTEPLLSVPGHEVMDVTNLGEGSTAWGARVRQRMADGRRFEVFHLEPGIDPSILPPMETGVGEVSTETPFGWVLVRGAMDDAELGDLLLRLFPESP
ncbi:MAG: hypothetical protein HKN72_04300 [Gemmatimonadetes bacterium]|nr:hypothetical protein [Gemmatimonadota bacterium]